MAGCKREVMEPSGREKVAAAAALVAARVSRREGVGIRRIAAPAGKNK